jgi:Zn-dependent alcohol dehydrogenase
MVMGPQAQAGVVVLSEFKAPLKPKSMSVSDPRAIATRVDLPAVCDTGVHLYHGRMAILLPVTLGHIESVTIGVLALG